MTLQESDVTVDVSVKRHQSGSNKPDTEIPPKPRDRAVTISFGLISPTVEPPACPCG